MNKILELSHNGDPYGRGFTATEYKDKVEYDSGIGIYRGDIGAMPRAYWRNYAKRNGYTLKEA